jgi:hypothetical protein
MYRTLCNPQRSPADRPAVKLLWLADVGNAPRRQPRGRARQTDRPWHAFFRHGGTPNIDDDEPAAVSRSCLVRRIDLVDRAPTGTPGRGAATEERQPEGGWHPATADPHIEPDPGGRARRFDRGAPSVPPSP